MKKIKIGRMKYKEFKKEYEKEVDKPVTKRLSIINLFCTVIAIATFTNNIVAALYFTVFLLFFRQFMYLIYLIVGDK